jgi:hypothetical protein
MHEYDASPAFQMQDQDTKIDNSEYKKLAGVFIVIILCASVMSFVLGFDWQEWVRWFIAGFFILFGSFKLIGYEDYINYFPTYNPIAKRFAYYNYVYPFIELLLGFLFASSLLPLFATTMALVLMGVGSYGILNQISKTDTYTKCVSLGNVIKLPLGNIALIEDTLIAVLAGIMLVSYFIF